MCVVRNDKKIILINIAMIPENNSTVNLVLVRTVKNNYFSLCTN